MPSTGEIQKGKALGYANKRAKFVWCGCTVCGKERWVMMNKGAPCSATCRDCFMTAETKAKMSQIRTQYHREHPEQALLAYQRMNTPAAILKRRKALLGRVVPYSLRLALSNKMKGNGNHFYGKEHTDETKAKMRLAPRPAHFRETMRRIALARPPKTDETKQRLREALARPEVKEKMRCAAKARSWGKGNSHWLGGISFEPYSSDFNDKLKEQIRGRDKYQCRLCGGSENGHSHHIHHINYDKKNCSSDNLITLCVPCHGRTSYHRNQWQIIFKQILEVSEHEN